MNFDLMIQSGDPYLFIKKLMAIDQPLKEYHQYAPSKLKGKCADYCKSLFDRAKDSENILISDEGFTLHPLRSNLFYVLKACEAITLPEEPSVAFRYGVEIAQKLFSSKSEFSNSLIAKLSISTRIKNILGVFNALPGKILVVERDYGSWFVSFYLQCFCGRSRYEHLSLHQTSWGISSLMTIAGFFWRWEECMVNEGSYGYVTAAGFFQDLASDFGIDSICKAKYSTNRGEFADSLASHLESFGISPELVRDRICKSRANDTTVKRLQDTPVGQILSSKEEIANLINQSCMLFPRRLAVALS